MSTYNGDGLFDADRIEQERSAENEGILLSVIVPVRDAQGCLKETLFQITEYLEAQVYGWELLIIDVGSSDNSTLIAHAVAEQWSQIRVFSLDRACGMGLAVQKGVLSARGRYTVVTDAALSTPIATIERFLPGLEEGYEVIVGSRVVSDSRILKRSPWPQRLTGLLARTLIHLLLVRAIRDSQCESRAYQTAAARHIFGLLSLERSASNVETLLLARELGYQVQEVGVDWTYRPRTGSPVIRETLRLLPDLYRVCRNMRERLNDDIEAVPLAHSPAIALFAVQSTNGPDPVPLALSLDKARRAGETVVLSSESNVAVLAGFGLTADEAEQTARRMAEETSGMLAAQGQSSAVTVDSHVLPLATPMPWLRDMAVAVENGDMKPHASLLSKLSFDEQQRDADRRVFARRLEAWKSRRRVVRLLVVANIFGLVWWLDWLFRLTNAATPLLYTLLVVAEFFNILQVLGYWYTVWHEQEPQRKRARVEGRIDAFITTYNEPIDLVERTTRAAIAMSYPHRTYILDDGNRPEVGAMAARVGAYWITRPDNSGAKAGNINHALKVTNGDFFVVFDADHVPHANLLDRLMPAMADERTAFVQAPQYYANRHKTFLTEAAMDQQELFFGPICKGKDGLGAVFCCGTNMVVRRTAIESIGGFREDSITEDAATSLDLHEHGWTSHYVPERLADGLAAEDLGAYISQQRRWARGNIEMLIRSRVLQRKMPLRLRLQYVWSAMYYLTSLTTVLYLSLPCLFLLFGIQTVSAQSTDFIGHFLPYIFMTIFILARSAEGRLRFRAIQLSYGLFPVFIGALYSVLTGRKVGFTVTPKEGRIQSFYHIVVPQIAAIAISLLSVLVGFAHYAGAATVTNACWAIFNVIMLSGIVYSASPLRPRQQEREKTPVVASFDDMRHILPLVSDNLSTRR